MTDRTAPASDWDALFGAEPAEPMKDPAAQPSPPTVPLGVLFLGEPTDDAATTPASPAPAVPLASPSGRRTQPEVHPTLLPAVRRRRILLTSAISIGALALVVGSVVLFQIVQSQSAAAEAAESASFERRAEALSEAETALETATTGLADAHAALVEKGLAAVGLADRARAAIDKLPDLIDPALADAVRTASDALATEAGAAAEVALPDAWTVPAVTTGDVAGADETLLLVQQQITAAEEAVTAVHDADARLTTAQNGLLAALDAVYGTVGDIVASAHEDNPLPDASFHQALDLAAAAPAAARAAGGDGIAELLAVEPALTALLDEQARLADIAAAEEAARQARLNRGTGWTGGSTGGTGGVVDGGGATTEPTAPPAEGGTTDPAPTDPPVEDVPPQNDNDPGTGGEPDEGVVEGLLG